jgi:hypothetical protein
MILIIECKTDDEPKYLGFANESARQAWEELKKEFLEDNDGFNHFRCELWSGADGGELKEEDSLVGVYA